MLLPRCRGGHRDGDCPEPISNPDTDSHAGYDTDLDADGHIDIDIHDRAPAYTNLDTYCDADSHIDIDTHYRASAYTNLDTYCDADTESLLRNLAGYRDRHDGQGPESDS